MSEKKSSKPTPPKPDKGIDGKVIQDGSTPPKPDRTINGAVIKSGVGKGKNIKK